MTEWVESSKFSDVIVKFPAQGADYEPGLDIPGARELSDAFVARCRDLGMEYSGSEWDAAWPDGAMFKTPAGTMHDKRVRTRVFSMSTPDRAAESMGRLADLIFKMHGPGRVVTAGTVGALVSGGRYRWRRIGIWNPDDESFRVDETAPERRVLLGVFYWHEPAVEKSK